jgi:uncharacterized protein
MNTVIVAFITGLTTGGLSCLAVQGGLLATSLAGQIEHDIAGQTPVQKKSKSKTQKTAYRPKAALPIALFLLAKLVMYTLLGALLGLLGSFLTISPVTRAILLIGIGIFMVGNALRMLNVHPFFRYFSIEPPKFITRYIRRKAKNGTDLTTPLFLGAMTIFIPCGVTQAMMAAAMGTGSAIQGATLMFAFTLGTSVIFGSVAYLATELGARLEKYFMRFVAITVLVLGFVTLNSGLNLLGSPVSFSTLARVLTPAKQAAPENVVAAPEASANLQLNVANQGYIPKTLQARANTPVRLDLVTNQTYTCARDFVIPALKYYQLLPASGKVTVNIPPQKAGTVLRFTCSMGMYTGQIVFN